MDHDYSAKPYFDAFCFYCKEGHGTPEALREHVMKKHAASPRAALFFMDKILPVGELTTVTTESKVKGSQEITPEGGGNMSISLKELEEDLSNTFIPVDDDPNGGSAGAPLKDILPAPGIKALALTVWSLMGGK